MGCCASLSKEGADAAFVSACDAIIHGRRTHGPAWRCRGEDIERAVQCLVALNNRSLTDYEIRKYRRAVRVWWYDDRVGANSEPRAEFKEVCNAVINGRRNHGPSWRCHPDQMAAIFKTDPVGKRVLTVREQILMTNALRVWYDQNKTPRSQRWKGEFRAFGC